MAVPPYLVTGGAGSIGSHLTAALLDARYRVRVFDNMSNPSTKKPDPRCELIYDDVACDEQIREAMSGVSGCFHFAAISSRESIHRLNSSREGSATASCHSAIRQVPTLSWTYELRRHWKTA